MGTMNIEETGALWIVTGQEIKTALYNCLVSSAIQTVNSKVLLTKDVGATNIFPCCGGALI
jgi:hypothetical protein